jgi:hypothetical protein
MKKSLLMAGIACMISMPAMAGGAGKADEWFKKMDTNADGMINKAEHDAFGEKMFKDADTDQDGSISKDEMKNIKMKEHAEVKGTGKDAPAVKTGMEEDTTH